jgi:hypothetical protein
MIILQIRVSLKEADASDLHDTINAALNALDRAAAKATRDEPALGGALRSGDGKIIGSYLVEFP